MALRTSKAGVAHTAGIFADMTLDGPEIGTLVAVIDRARHLPNRKTMGKQDPYCAMRLGKEAKKTETDRRGGQTPKWDQELRFTVHESPDYYKLKCSVFNDDKKTDLIGESFIDLREVIVAGGGQNDLWHPLYFKGKTAGEIRVEMTYYDSRPQDESVLEKKREKERRHFTRQGSPLAAADLSGPRQLGPREVKRRPLPPGPGSGSQSPATGPSTPDAPLPQLPQPQRSGSDRGFLASQTPERVWNHPDDFQALHIVREDLAPVSQPTAGYLSRTADASPAYQAYGGPPDSQQGGWYDAPPQSSYQYSPEEQCWTNSPPPLTVRSHPSPPSYASSPPSATQSPDSRNLSSQHRHSISPIKLNHYRDSPLRQSISHDEPYCYQNDVADDLDNYEAPPPPPPVHRATFGELPPAPSKMQSQPPIQVSARDRSFPASPLDVRSPLQLLEHNFDPYHHAQPSPHPSMSPNTYDILAAQNSPARVRSHDEYGYGDPREITKIDNLLPKRNSGTFGNDYEADESALYGSDPRRSSNGPPDSYESPAAYESPASYRSRNGPQPRVYHSQVPLVRPRAISPNAQGVAQRKSVSPHPASENGRRDSVPLSPHSYGTANDTAELVAIPYVETPEQMKEALRQREVEKLDDLGPIIGNDGREIDPSDHIPSSNWAPEPERKDRKPEVVIRFKNRGGTPRGATVGSSPASARPLSGGIAPQANTPVSASRNRETPNRLQKQMPIRPLPAQPFQHAHSSPAVATMARPDMPTPPRPDFPQQSHYSTPSPRSGMPPRPSMLDYSLYNIQDFGNSPTSPQSTGRPPALPRKEPFYNSPREQEWSSPRGSPYTQRRSPLQSRQENLPSAPRYDDFTNSRHIIDPLSAELSTINIGPSRGGRTTARFNRGYGM